VDDHTIGCPSGGVTFLPVPRGTDPNFAGLLTVELPAGIRKGDVHEVTVRQITAALSRTAGREVRQLDGGAVFKGEGQPELVDDEGEEVEAPVAFVAAEGFSTKRGALIVWRRVLGVFKVTIPVSSKSALLEPELRLLSVLRWIQDAIPLYSRWYPVFDRYVTQVAGRVRDLGGDPDQAKADPNGDPDGKIRGEYDGGRHPCERHEWCHCGCTCHGCCCHGCGGHRHDCGHNYRGREGDVRDELEQLAERAVRMLRDVAGEEYEALRRLWRRGPGC
jgi:hypothetical protein